MQVKSLGFLASIISSLSPCGVVAEIRHVWPVYCCEIQNTIACQRAIIAVGTHHRTVI